MPYQQSANKGLRDSLPKAKIRVLLALWDWDATENTAIRLMAIFPEYSGKIAIQRGRIKL
jgi:hypothetical protein